VEVALQLKLTADELALLESGGYFQSRGDGEGLLMQNYVNKWCQLIPISWGDSWMDNYIATKKEIGISIPAGNLLSLLHWVKRVFTIIRITATTPSVKTEKGDMLNMGCDTWRPIKQMVKTSGDVYIKTC
jgi:hypothetical protein